MKMTLTIDQIRGLAMFCGMVIQGNLTEQEYTDEKETQISIVSDPEAGEIIVSDEGVNRRYLHIAYYDEYPEEGCCPLGDEITHPSTPPEK